MDKLKGKLDGETLKDMYASSDRKKFARNLLTPIIERETAKRERIHALSEEQMIQSVRSVLEEINDAYTEDGENTVFA